MDQGRNIGFSFSAAGRQSETYTYSAMMCTKRQISGFIKLLRHCRTKKHHRDMTHESYHLLMGRERYGYRY